MVFTTFSFYDAIVLFSLLEKSKKTYKLRGPLVDTHQLKLISVEKFTRIKQCKRLNKVGLGLVHIFYNGPTPASFCLFSFFSHDKYSTNLTVDDKSIDGVLGTRTRGGNGRRRRIHWARDGPYLRATCLVVVKLTHLLEALDHVCADVKVGIEGAEEEFSRLVRHVQDVVHDDVWKITFRWWWERKRQAMLLAVWPDWTIF